MIISRSSILRLMALIYSFYDWVVFHCIYIYHTFFIHSSVDEHLGCFHVLTILNSTAKIIEEHVSFMKMNFAKHQRIEPSCQENQLWIEDRNLVSFLDFQGGERGIEVESITKWVNHASTKKKKKGGVQKASIGGEPEHFYVLSFWFQASYGQKVLLLGLHPMYLFIWHYILFVLKQ